MEEYDAPESVEEDHAQRHCRARHKEELCASVQAHAARAHLCIQIMYFITYSQF